MQIGKEYFSVRQAEQAGGSKISWFSGTEFSDSSQVPTQMGSLLKTNWALARNFYI